MDRRSFIVASASVLTYGARPSLAAEPQKSDSVKIEVEGPLDTIIRDEKSKQVSATVSAGGGEFFIDASRSKAAKEELTRLGDKYIKAGSDSIRLPRVTVTGKLEFRDTKVVGENGKLTDGPKVWVLVAESVAESK